MSQIKRYQALNEQVLAARHGHPLRLDIVGHEHLVSEHYNVMLEDAATSFQLHFKTPFSKVQQAYNAAILVTAPVVAACANSPVFWTLFGRTVVYFIRPTGTQSAAMASICPAVTLECGKPGEPHGVDHAAEFLDVCLHFFTLPETAVADHDIDLFHTVAQVKIPRDLDFSFDSNTADLNFVSNLERLNFQEIPQGTVFAHCATQKAIKLEVTDEHGDDVADNYFVCSRDKLKLRREVMPSMLTLDKQVIRQDCLCYLMERISLSAP